MKTEKGCAKWILYFFMDKKNLEIIRYEEKKEQNERELWSMLLSLVTIFFVLSPILSITMNVSSSIKLTQETRSSLISFGRERIIHPIRLTKQKENCKIRKNEIMKKREKLTQIIELIGTNENYPYQALLFACLLCQLK